MGSGQVVFTVPENAAVLRLQGTRRAGREPYVILEAKIVCSDRCCEKTVSRKGREIDLWYSGKK